MNQQPTRRIYDVVANRDRIAYVIGITRELISSPFDPRDDWLTSDEQRARYSLEEEGTRGNLFTQDLCSLTKGRMEIIFNNFEKC